MTVSKETEQQYEECRLAMRDLERHFRVFFWAHIIIGFLFAWFAIYATMETSTRDPNLHGADKWYYGINTGAMQFLFCFVTIGLGFWAGMRKRLPSILLLLGFGWLIARIIISRDIAMAAGNMMLAVAGFGLNGWAQYLIVKEDRLRGMPGYPIFSVQADIRAEYEPPLYVTMSRPSDEMKSVGEAMYTTQQSRQQKGPLPDADSVLTDTLSASGSRTVPSEGQLSASEGISLENFAAQTAAGRRDPEQAALSAAPADVLLSDMTADASRSGRTQTGDVSALPDPEEVRARLAAMKAARGNSTDMLQNQP